jgi:hypothetical protein
LILFTYQAVLTSHQISYLVFMLGMCGVVGEARIYYLLLRLYLLLRHTINTASQTGVEGIDQTAVSHSRPSCLQSRSATALHLIQTVVALPLEHPSCLRVVRSESHPPTKVVRFSPDAPSIRVIPSWREPWQPSHPSHDTVYRPVEFFSLAAPSVTSQQRDLILHARA